MAHHDSDQPTQVLDGTYRLCPQCFRAVPARSGEIYCANDGARLLETCPSCRAPITSPYARFCPKCGHEFSPDASRSRISGKHE